MWLNNKKSPADLTESQTQALRDTEMQFTYSTVHLHLIKWSYSFPFQPQQKVLTITSLVFVCVSLCAGVWVRVHTEFVRSKELWAPVIQHRNVVLASVLPSQAA